MYSKTILLLLLLCLSIGVQAQSVYDDFEGNGTISTWTGDNCNINTSVSNPYQLGINTSSTVLEYHDIGGQYANIRFDESSNFDLSRHYTFSIKIYVPSSGITGSSPNQVTLKLQDGTLAQPWVTQSEIIKSISLDQWQTLTFDFLNDNYVNLDPSSAPPTQRTDFNRVLIQVNGENNNDHVLAYIDDVLYDTTINTASTFNVLVWSDEFDTDGTINSSNWYHQTQLPTGGNWYNGEIQHYTNRLDNTFVSSGILNILAKKETYTDQGHTKQYTSARLNSKFAFKYGKVEVRAKLPTGIGTWPAIWLLGKNINEDGAYWDNQGYGTTAWPACGEIDIMEHWGSNQNYIQSATHTSSSSGNTVNKGGQTISTASSSFHTYTLEWTSEKLIFSVDDVVHYIYNPATKDATTWPFDAEMYIILNVAILPSIDAGFTQDAMEIDYVRVYQATPSIPLTAAPTPVHHEVTDNVISIFSDAYTDISGTNFNPPWMQTTVSTIETIDGNTTLKYDNLNYQGTEFGSNQDVSGANYLHINYWAKNSTDLGIYLVSPGPVETEYVFTPLLTEQWVTVDIPLTSFSPVDLTNAFQFKVEGNGTVYLDNLYFHSGTPIPVELSSFIGKAIGKHNLLSWQTASELNNSHFEVERSLNGIDFKVIGTVEGYGTRLETANYEFFDKHPPISAYYRLRQIDFNGDYQFSEIINIKHDSPTHSLKIFPVPIRDNLNIDYSATTDEAIFATIINMTGQVIISKQLIATTGRNLFNLDCKSLPSGCYFVRLRSEQHSNVHTIVKY